MKKILILSLALALVFPASASAKTHKITSVGKYTYTYHRLATIKCPYFGCRRSFSKKG